GYLALGDLFVVTGDSMSMLVEACATGRSVLIFDLGLGRYSMRYAASRLVSEGEAQASVPIAARLRSSRLRLTTSLLPMRYRRDIHAILRYLTETRLARWVGEPQGAPSPIVLPDSARIAADAVRRIADVGVQRDATPRAPEKPVRLGPPDAV